MSTILKALEKNKQQPIFSDLKADRRWKFIIAAALLMIMVLFSVVIFLLVKPIEKAAIEFEAVQPQRMAIAESQPLVVAPEVVANASKNRVGEVHFDTTPLLLATENASTTWLKAEVTNPKIDPEPGGNVNTKPVSARGNANNADSNVSISDISNELKQRFALAVELEQDNQPTVDVQAQDRPLSASSEITSLPARFQYQVPAMRYDSHVYSTIEKDRWIRINGVDLKEGDHIGDIELLEILPQQSVFRLGKQSFTLQSLDDWAG